MRSIAGDRAQFPGACTGIVSKATVKGRRSPHQYVLTVKGGLCNRLRSLTSAQFLCARRGATLCLIWNARPECPAEFKSLFEVPAGIVLGDPGTSANTTYWDLGLGWATPEYYRRVFLPELAPQEMLARVRPYVQGLRPVRGIRDRIEDHAKHWPAGIVGVHVRRTDHSRPTAQGRKFTRDIPSDAALLRRLNALPPERSFFVAADNPDSMRLLEDAYPGRVYSHPKRWLHAWRQTGVADAVVDLYCLARTSRIVGTFYSSFSEYAALLGSLPIEYVDAEGEMPCG